MMYDNSLFWLLLVAHLFGDFYFQSDKMVREKATNVKVLLCHGLIYFIVLLVLLLPIMSWLIAGAVLMVAIAHFFIDLLKERIKKNDAISSRPRKVFLIDQLLHCAIIGVIAYIYAKYDLIALNTFGDWLIDTYNNLQIDVVLWDFLKLCFVFLIIGRPANIVVQELNNKEYIENVKDENDATTANYKNAGRTIGILERFLIVIMILLQQYAAIGLILTAKSITRYDKIVKIPSFAEYYLVGTLLSFLIAVLAVIFVNINMI